MKSPDEDAGMRPLGGQPLLCRPAPRPRPRRPAPRGNKTGASFVPRHRGRSVMSMSRRGGDDIAHAMSDKLNLLLIGWMHCGPGAKCELLLLTSFAVCTFGSASNFPLSLNLAVALLGAVTPPALYAVTPPAPSYTRQGRTARAAAHAERTSRCPPARLSI